MEAETFNASFYSTVAQVIPVFLIFAVATRFFGDKAAAVLPLHMNLLLVVMVLSGVWAESSALTALRDEKAPSGLEDMVIIWAIVLPMIFILAESLPKPVASIIEDVPRSLRPFLDWGGKALVIGLIPALLLGLNIAAIIAGMLVVMLCIALVLPTLTDAVGAYRRRRQKFGDDEPG